LLPIAEKRALDLARVHEPPVSCPDCNTKVLPVDLLPHMDQRCPGLPEPGPSSRWLNYRQAIDFGVRPRTLDRWTRNGQIRSRGGRGERQYLERDLVVRIAQRRAWRRR